MIIALQVVWDISFVLNYMAFYMVLRVQTSQPRLPSVTASLMPPGLVQTDAALRSTEGDLALDVLFIFLLSLENLVHAKFSPLQLNTQTVALRRQGWS